MKTFSKQNFFFWNNIIIKNYQDIKDTKEILKLSHLFVECKAKCIRLA